LKAPVTILVFCVAALLALGMVMLYSSSMSLNVGAGYLVKQLVWAGIGLIACVTVATIDYRHLRKLALPLFIVSVVLLALVLVPCSYTMKIGGSRRWFDVHGFRFQPSELAKLALVLVLAWHADRHLRKMGTWKHGIVIPCAIMGMIVGLVFVEPDRGTSILLAAVGSGMLVVAGVKLRAIFAPVLAAGCALAFSLWNDPMRIKRIFSWLDLEETRQGVGYQAYQAMVAFGAGGLNGLGLGNGRQKLGFIPEHHTDFILSVIGEELGLIATLLVVLAFISIVVCGVTIAWRASDNFGMLMASGITFLIGLQAFINIGVVTSALPNKGLPLPFISYGGSNLLMMMTGVGLLLSVARRARIPEMEPEIVPEAADSTVT
jgi:cell division protein FtsW